MELPESPLEVCHYWLSQSVPRVSPPSLTVLCLRRTQNLIRLYSTSTEETNKLTLRRSLRALFDVPNHFIPLLLETVLECQNAGVGSDQSPMDLFLISQVTHPLISYLDMQLIPTSMRNYVIRNMARLSGLRTLNLCLSLNIPWSAFFSPAQTERLAIALSGLRVLVFQDLADDDFLSQIGHHCIGLGKTQPFLGIMIMIVVYFTASLDVQGSIQVSDTGLASLASLEKIEYLDVNRTNVSASMLAELVRRTPSIVSLGSWEEFSDFDEDILQNLTEVSTASFTLNQCVKVTSCSSLTKLQLKMTNSSDKIHTLGGLRYQKLS